MSRLHCLAAAAGPARASKMAASLPACLPTYLLTCLTTHRSGPHVHQGGGRDRQGHRAGG